MSEPDGSCLGIDVGGTKVSAALFARDGEMSRRQKLPLDRSGGTAAADQIGDLIHEYETLADAQERSIRAVGIAIPGIVFQHSGNVWAPNVPAWDRFPLRGHLSERTRLPLVLGSDRSAYVLGESWRGAAVGKKDVVFLAVGTGIGAGLLVNGRVCRGGGDIAGAVGWFALKPEYRGEYAQKGCFETEASGIAVGERAVALIGAGHASLIQDLVDGDLEKVTAETVVQGARQNDPLARAVLDESVRYLAMGIANMISMLNPEVVVLGGGLFQAGDLLLEPVRSEVKKWVQPLAGEQARIELSALGEDAGLFGAGKLAWDHLG